MADKSSEDKAGLEWQLNIWNRMSQTYLDEIDKRFAQVISKALDRAALEPGQRVLDLGTGTGSVALGAAPLVLPDGEVFGIDISPEMLHLAESRRNAAGLKNIAFRVGRGEDIPAPANTFDILIASLSLMYVIDRAAAARECARVLKPGGSFVAVAWGGPEVCDIVKFQQIAGSFAPVPPVAGVGPGALADPAVFIEQLAHAGITAQVEQEEVGFDFENFNQAWEVLAHVTAGQLLPERVAAARAATQAALWPDQDGPRRFRNLTQFIVGRRNPE